MDTSERNKAVVRRFLGEFLSCGDHAVADELLAPGFIDHDPSNPDLTGIENVKQSVRDFCNAFPDCVAVVDEIIADNACVAGRWTSTATHRGPFLGIASTGRRVTVTASGLFHVIEQLGGTIVPATTNAPLTPSISER